MTNVIDREVQDSKFTYGSADYLALNAQLNYWETDANGNKVIPFEKDKEALTAYFKNHVNPNIQFFPSLEEKLEDLVDNGYYDAEFLKRYSTDFIKGFYKALYKRKHRFASFLGAYKFYQSYSLRNYAGDRFLETFTDRVAACALYMAQGDEAQALRLGEEMITGRLQPATPTFMNSGRARGGELVSCFLLGMEDDLNSIFRTINSSAQLSKRGGGVAICLSNIRSAGDPIQNIAEQSSGVLPIMKLLEDTFSYVDQLGQRQGAGAAYLNVFHSDIQRFLDTKRENADEKIRIKSLSLGVLVPDILFELARNDEEMYTFSSYDAARVYGTEFAYIDITKEYRAMVDNPNIRNVKVPGGARRFLANLAEIQMESGYPYLIFVDEANRANQNEGTIIMSNLCSEIFQTTKPSKINEDLSYAELGKDISCNLASLNMRKALQSPDFAATIDTAIRMLTQVSDLSHIGAVPTVAAGNDKSHAIGLGVMNVQGAFGYWNMAYGEAESLDLLNAYYQLVTYHALRTSNAIARERGKTYEGFENSGYASGAYFQKFLAEENQHLYVVKHATVQAILDEYNHVLPTREDWAELAEAVKRDGLYNAYLQAVAPTGSISYISGSTPSAMPITGRLESRKEGKLGKVAFPAPEMNMHNIQYFKTAYEIPVEYSIDVYSLIMWYVDQSASQTLHFPAGSGARDVSRAQLYAFSKGKASKKAPTERSSVLAQYPQAGIKSLYYYRVAADVLDDLKSDTVASASFAECESCSI